VGSSVILPARGQPARGPDPSFKTAAQPNVTSFKFASNDPPSALYVQRDDQLILRVTSSLAGEAVVLAGALLLAPFERGGQPDAGAAATIAADLNASNTIVSPNARALIGAAYTTNTQILALSEGYMMRLVAQGASAANRGRTFVSLSLARGSGPTTLGAQVLLSDYLQLDVPLGWPGGRLQSPTEGPGWKHSLQQANPLAGADWTLTLNAVQRLRIESFNAAFAASAAAATRNISILVDDGVNVLYVGTVPTAFVAGQSGNVSGTTGSINTPVLPLQELVPLPSPLILEPGWRIRSFTQNIQAGDAWTNIWFNVEEWLEVI
jgi:hypothetical protein